MFRTGLKVFLLTSLMLACSNCSLRHASYRLDGDDHYNHHRRSRAVVYDHGHHVCNRNCHDHYWNGLHYVSLEHGHHHGHDCGHAWNGKSWITAKIMKDYSHDKHKKYKKYKKYKKKHKKNKHGQHHSGH